ncbi:hypothetical protein HYALB_00010090 [Hymenoscyphus albidus]|uniref:Cyanovirin-N domain-containing protein n=1 Tax=Hymenoscyphus albidus TaxID=595503 RepID=A0A9N9LEN7_9HELO|nr:hypothetical protein HYALB_00010090 [Hymenoscyphus albidus]
MHITNLLTAIITTSAILSSTATAWDFKIKRHPGTSCSGNGGPVREFSRGSCQPLYSTDKDLEVIEHVEGCKIRGYPGGNCDGGAKTAFSSHQCHNVDGLWSFRMEC